MGLQGSPSSWASTWKSLLYRNLNRESNIVPQACALGHSPLRQAPACVSVEKPDYWSQWCFVSRYVRRWFDSCLWECPPTPQPLICQLSGTYYFLKRYRQRLLSVWLSDLDAALFAYLALFFIRQSWGHQLPFRQTCITRTSKVRFGRFKTQD